MPIFFNPYDSSPKYTGAVVRRWVAGYDKPIGLYSFATVWDAQLEEFVEISCGETLDEDLTAAFEDADASVMKRWNDLPDSLRAKPVAPLVPGLPRLSMYRWRNSVEEPGPPDRFGAALAFASRLHRAQFRKGTRIPYVSHLLAVASIALEYGATEDEAIAALLHDAIEDQGGAATGDRIRQLFGDEVHGIVVACSDTDVVPKPPWRERKQAYIEHVQAASASVKLVSAADKLHNARSTLSDVLRLGDQAWERFSAPKQDQLWYYTQLVAAFRVGRLPRKTLELIDELERVVTAIPR